MSYQVGSIKKVFSKDGKEYFAGMVGRFPVTGFWGKQKNNQNIMYFSLDYGKAKYLDEQDQAKAAEKAKEADKSQEGEGKENNKPQEEIKEQ